MARKKAQNLTELEQILMNIIWDEPGCAVETIRERLETLGHPLALPSIRTMTGILEKKGYISREAEGRRHLFFPEVSREQAQQSTLRELLQKAFGGSPLSLAATLLNSDMVSKDDIDEVKKLLKEKEKSLKK